VVLEFHSYIPVRLHLRHHQALAGGTSISELRWSTDSLRINERHSSWEVEVPPAKAWWCLTGSKNVIVAMKLKYHRLKPGGVSQDQRTSQ